jgi:hypothetical protein
MGFSDGQMQFIASDANGQNIYGQIRQYLGTNPSAAKKANARLQTDLLSSNLAYYAANVATGFLATTIADLVRYLDKAYSGQEFADLYSNQTHFTQMDAYLINHNFDANAKDLVKLHSETLKSNSEYRQANASMPTLGTEAWAQTLKFNGVPPNATEIVLSTLYPISALYVAINSVAAVTKEEELFPNHPIAGIGISNAFRHAYWNALNASTAGVGPNIAKLFGDAHEVGSTGLATEMDLFNNAVGIQIGIDTGTFMPEDIRATRVLDAINTGRLKYLCCLQLIFTNQTC